MLADDSPAAGTKRRSDGDFALTTESARKQQLGDVRAGNQQHEGNRAEQGEKRRSRRLDNVML